MTAKLLRLRAAAERDVRSIIFAYRADAGKAVAQRFDCALRYLDEFEWRWNRRDMGEGHRVNALLGDTAGRLTYQELIGVTEGKRQ